MTPQQIDAVRRQAERWLFAAQQDKSLVVRLLHANYAVAYFQYLLESGVQEPPAYKVAIDLERKVEQDLADKVGVLPVARAEHLNYGVALIDIESSVAPGGPMATEIARMGEFARAAQDRMQRELLLRAGEVANPAGAPHGGGGHGGHWGHGGGHWGHGVHPWGRSRGGWGGWGWGGLWGWYPYWSMTSWPDAVTQFLARAGYTCASWNALSADQKALEVITLVMTDQTIREGGVAGPTYAAQPWFRSYATQFVASVDRACR